MKIESAHDLSEFFRGPLDFGIIRRAREAGLVTISVHDLRSFAHDRHRTVDDRPFGGGEGMVLKPEPIFECIESLNIAPRAERLDGRTRQSVVLLSAQGKRFDQSVAGELAKLEQIVLICGRYEGVDERVAESLADRELSVGDFRAQRRRTGCSRDCRLRYATDSGSGGQRGFNPAGIVHCACPGCKRQRPSSTCGSGGLLDYPHYTRPAEFRGMPVPEVLISGNHDEIRRWRRRTALEKTLRNRPDLLEQTELSEEDKILLAQIKSREA